MRLEVIDGDYDSSRRCKEFIARLSDCQGLCVRGRIAGRGRGLRGKGGTRGAVTMLGRDVLRLGVGHGDVKGLAKGLRRSFLVAFGVKTKALGLNGVFLRGDQLWFEPEKVGYARSYF
jgi:hypothetical protein